MNNLRKIIVNFLFISVLFGSISCSKETEEPEYSIIPTIELSDIYFVKSDSYEYKDTLALKIKYTDGDADFGLDDSFTEAPYNTLNYFLKNDGSYLTYSDRNTPPYDTLPPYEFPYYCYNYAIDWENNCDIDTFYVQQNRNHYNIFIDYYRKKEGKYELFDFKTTFGQNCGENYYGRIEGPSIYGVPLKSGKIEYPMWGARLYVIFKNDTLKLKIQIQDRALNKSNIIETPEFTLQEITKD
ncbi:MAG: hypothetical protein KDC79_04105 [Cyclobacteriaceae bacterium]|nr:hypothetical protein [Cyclobacteriaceae bacterium]